MRPCLSVYVIPALSLLFVCTNGCRSPKAPDHAEERPPAKIQSSEASGTNALERYDDETEKALAFFRTNQTFARVKYAQKVVPVLKLGMSKQRVEALLGPPTWKDDLDKVWCYGVWYSQNLEIYFDEEWKIKRVHPVGM